MVLWWGNEGEAESSLVMPWDLNNEVVFSSGEGFNNKFFFLCNIAVVPHYRLQYPIFTP